MVLGLRWRKLFLFRRPPFEDVFSAQSYSKDKCIVINTAQGRLEVVKRIHYYSLPYRDGNRASGQGFGCILVGRAYKSALRPAGGPILRLRPAGGPTLRADVRPGIPISGPEAPLSLGSVGRSAHRASKLGLPCTGPQRTAR